jgi:CRP/FNR family transcriptional regulator
MSTELVLRRVPSLQGADEETFSQLARFSSLRTLKRGDLLWSTGTPARSFTVVKSGLLKILRTGQDGRRTICGLFGPPESIGDIVLLRGARYPADAIVASESATIITAPREVLLGCVERCPALGASIACSMHTKLAALHGSIEVLSAGTVESRLATALLKLYDQLGDEFEDGTCSIPVVLSRRELAELVSTSLETAIRVMTRWERQGVLETTGEGFNIVDRGALLRVTGRTMEEEPAE